MYIFKSYYNIKIRIFSLRTVFSQKGKSCTARLPFVAAYADSILFQNQDFATRKIHLV